MQAVSTSTIVTGAKARVLVLRALSMGARAIGSSLGPNGRGLLYDGGSGGPQHSSSGLDIARRVTEESGAGTVALRILRDALWDVQRDLEDGTARTACIAVAIYAEAAKHISHGTAPALLCKEIQQLQSEMPALVEVQRCEAADGFDVARSACADEDIARTLSDAYCASSEKGAIDIQQGTGSDVKLERYSGYCLDVVPEAAGLSTEEQGLRVEMDSAHVLVVNEILSDFGPLARILEQFALHSKALVIVARGFEGAARSTLAANRAALRMHVLGLIPAEVGEQAMHLLDDLCVATGATVISEETGTSMANVRPSMLGRTSRLILERGRAIFSEPSGDVNAIHARRALLFGQAASQRYLALDREKLQRRAARLAGNWAVFRIGGRTHWEREQRVGSARAALAALAASRASGVVAGGGQALLAVAASIMSLKADSAGDVRRAALDSIAAGCRAVAAQLTGNAGSSVVESEFKYQTVDPLSTTVAILQHAISVAATMLTVEVLIC
jgi:chaperonin GroEL